MPLNHNCAWASGFTDLRICGFGRAREKQVVQGILSPEALNAETLQESNLKFEDPKHTFSSQHCSACRDLYPLAEYYSYLSKYKLWQGYWGPLRFSNWMAQDFRVQEARQ